MINVFKICAFLFCLQSCNNLCKTHIISKIEMFDIDYFNEDISYYKMFSGNLTGCKIKVEKVGEYKLLTIRNQDSIVDFFEPVYYKNEKVGYTKQDGTKVLYEVFPILSKNKTKITFPETRSVYLSQKYPFNDEHLLVFEKDSSALLLYSKEEIFDGTEMIDSTILKGIVFFDK